MKKFKAYIIPVLTILLFIAIMTTGGLLKKPFSSKDDVISYIEIMRKDINEEKWDKAGKDLSNIKTAWEIVKKRVQFSVERDEMILIDTNISRIEGALSERDKSFIIIELSEMQNHWNELEK